MAWKRRPVRIRYGPPKLKHHNAYGVLILPFITPAQQERSRAHMIIGHVPTLLPENIWCKKNRRNLLGICGKERS